MDTKKIHFTFHATSLHRRRCYCILHDHNSVASVAVCLVNAVVHLAVENVNRNYVEHDHVHDHLNPIYFVLP